MERFLRAPAFSELVGVSRQHIRNLYVRGVLNRTPEGNYDILAQKNIKWIVAHLPHHKVKTIYREYEAQLPPEIFEHTPGRPKRVEIRKVEPKKPRPIKTPLIHWDEEKKDIAVLDEQGINSEKRKIDLKQKELNAIHKQIIIDKLNNSLIDVNLVRKIISAFIRAHATTLFRDLESFVSKILDIHKIPLAEKTKYISQIEQMMNRADVKAKEKILDIIEKIEMDED